MTRRPACCARLTTSLPPSVCQSHFVNNFQPPPKPCFVRFSVCAWLFASAIGRPHLDHHHRVAPGFATLQPSACGRLPRCAWGIELIYTSRAAVFPLLSHFPPTFCAESGPRHDRVHGKTINLHHRKSFDRHIRTTPSPFNRIDRSVTRVAG